jgi:hypothetical protein
LVRLSKPRRLAMRARFLKLKARASTSENGSCRRLSSARSASLPLTCQQVRWGGGHMAMPSGPGCARGVRLLVIQLSESCAAPTCIHSRVSSSVITEGSASAISRSKLTGIVAAVAAAACWLLTPPLPPPPPLRPPLLSGVAAQHG